MKRDEVAPLPAELRDLLRAEEKGLPPPADVARRLLDRVEVSVRLPSPPLGDAAVGLGLKTTLVFVLGAGVGVTGTLGAQAWWKAPQSARPMDMVAAAPETVAVAVEQPVQTSPAARKPAASKPRPVTFTPPSNESLAMVPETQRAEAPIPEVVVTDTALATTLARERSLLDVARTALGRRDFSAALAALERLALEIPEGRLVEERAAITVSAVAGAGHLTEARERAAAFHCQYPKSLLGAFVRAAVDSGDGTAAGTPIVR